MKNKKYLAVFMAIIFLAMSLAIPSNTALAVTSKPVAIFYSPHADDEVLSMGMAISDYIAKGYDVHVVLITHGYDSSAINLVNGTEYCKWHKRFHNPLAEGYKPITKEELGAIRVNEFIKSTEKLGVPRNNIFICNYNKDIVYPQQLKELMLSFEKQYPDAIHCTTSYYDKHPFHRKVAQALLDLYNEGQIKNAQFYLSPGIWETLKGGTIVFNEALKTRVKESLDEYKKWDPQKGEFGIGFHSVPVLFETVEKHLYSRFINPNEVVF